MKKEDFRFMIDCKQAYEFEYNGFTYNITYGNDSKGDFVAFGRLYEQQKYYSWASLMQDAKVENTYLKDFIENL